MNNTTPNGNTPGTKTPTEPNPAQPAVRPEIDRPETVIGDPSQPGPPPVAPNDSPTTNIQSNR